MTSGHQPLRQILVDKREENDARRFVDLTDGFLELRGRADERVEMFDRFNRVILRDNRTADGDQGFSCRVGD